jgi:hypothetical protein
MSFFKATSERKSAPVTQKDALRQKRLAHEQAQKDAGIWGDMAVGQITGRAMRLPISSPWRTRSRAK